MKLNSKGQATVEFALAALIFFTLMLAMVDLGILFYVNLTMQQAVREGTRYAVTGRHEPGLDRRATLIRVIRNASNGLYDKNVHVPRDPVISVVTPGGVSFANYSGTPAAGDPGLARDIIVVRLTYEWPLLTPILKPFFAGGNYAFTVKAIMRNEPFAGAGT